MIFFIITASFLWWATLANFVLRDYDLLVKTTRIATIIYLVVFGLFSAEVLREGLIVLGLEELQWRFRLMWMLWFALVIAGILSWPYLILATFGAFGIINIPEEPIFLLENAMRNDVATLKAELSVDSDWKVMTVSELVLQD
ncbi:hypothetical protein F5Y13DRAFT_194152 [Hypoxylon sp. FL1857]|nr:hypothetical protein F5Y13DRAFT_194152 [Hypoxylon sp. FL1857]